VFDKFSLKNQSPEINLYLRLTFWLFALLLLTKFSPIGAGLTVLVVAAQVFIGMQVLALSRVDSAQSALVRTGLGFCLGVILTSLIYVITVSYTSVLIALGSQIVIFVAALILWFLRRSECHSFVTLQDISAIKWIAVATLFILSPEWFWPFPIAITISIVFLMREYCWSKGLITRLTFAVISTIVSVIVWLLVLSSRPLQPRLFDDLWMEIWTFSFGKWGFSHNPMMMGESISYHWFSFAWTGQMTHLTLISAANFVQLQGVVVIAFAVSILILIIIKIVSENERLAIVAMLVICATDTKALFRGIGFHFLQLHSFSQFFSLCLALGLVVLLIDCGGSSFNHSTWIIGLLMLGVIGSKSSTGMCVIVGVFGASISQINFKKGTFRVLIRSWLTLGIYTLVGVVLFYGIEKSASDAKLGRPAWPLNVYGNLWNLYNGPMAQYMWIVILMSIALGGFGILTFLAILTRMKSKKNLRPVTAFLFFAGLAAGFQMLLGVGDARWTTADISLYGFQFWVAAVTIIGVGTVLQTLSQPISNRTQKCLIVSATITGVLPIAINHYWKVEIHDRFWTLFLFNLKTALPFVVASVFCVSSFLLFKISRRRDHSFLVSLSYGLLAIGVSNLFLYVQNWKGEVGQEYRSWRIIEANYYQLNSDNNKAISWILNSTNSDSILASKNNLNGFSLSVTTGRREFAGIPFTERLLGAHSEREKANRFAIDEFALKGNCDSSLSLRDSGVNYFFVNVTESFSPDIKRCAGEVFRNKTIVIYSFNLS
jgi:hypothetical protein